MDDDAHAEEDGPLSPTMSRAPRYEGEDISPTTNRELQGWYCYGMAAEVFAVVGTGSFLPVTIEQLARENGVLWSDRSTPCPGSSKAASRLFTRDGDGSTDNGQCVIKLYGIEMTSSSLVMYTFSCAVFIQALTLVSFSAFADHGNNRKRLLLFFAYVGAATGMAFIFITPSTLLLAPLLSIICITCLGCSFVMLNSFLPLLTSNHPSVRAIVKVNETPTQPARPIKSYTLPPTALLSNTISSRGVALGYTTAVLVQLLAIAILFLASHFTTSKTLPLRFILFLSGLWWAIFSIPTALFLRPRPGPPLPTSLTKPTTHLPTTLTHLLYAWSTLYKTLLHALSLPTLRLFLLAWFLLSDALATTSTVAILFARTTLSLPPTSIALLSLTATCSGILGATLLPLLSKHYHLSTHRTILMCILLLLSVPLYTLFYYLSPIRHLGFLGLQQPWEIFPLAVIFGIAQGGISSYARSFYGQMIPRGKEVAFYALFAITDKGSSAVGPAIVGGITDWYGGIRPAFLVLVVLVAGAGVVVWFVGEGEDEGRRGMGEAMNWEGEGDVELDERVSEREGLMERIG